jgi:cytochrome c oxidase subunit IV
MSRPGKIGARSARAQKKGEPELRVYLGVWAALMALLAITVASSFAPLGAWNSVINLGVAALKAFLVAAFFMHLRSSTPLVRLVALVGVVWLSILLGLSLTDVLTRGG